MDIISLPIEYDRTKIDSKYRLCSIASQRAKELSLGVKPKVQTKARKVTTIALEEAIDNTLEFITGEEARIAREKSSKLDYRKLLEESRKAAAGEDLSELEKDLKVYLHEKETIDRKTLDELFSERKEDAEESPESEE
ncbi:MAG: DNA-directed RNA polymerase subunit omega [Thermodesulfovibrionales bacterium]